jgi:hypothetical protein
MAPSHMTSDEDLAERGLSPTNRSFSWGFHGGAVHRDVETEDESNDSFEDALETLNING